MVMYWLPLQAWMFESTGVVGVELGKREVRDVELIGGGQCGGLVSGVFWFISGWCIQRGKWCKAI
jgi:hypothetical protein